MKKVLTYILTSSLILLLGCKKEETGYGKISIGVTNLSSSNYSMGVFMDGNNMGTFIINPRTNGVPTCTDQDPQKNNVYMLTYIPSGKHKIELIESSNASASTKGEVTVRRDDCSTLQFYF